MGKVEKAVEGKKWVRRQFRSMGKDVGEGEYEEHQVLVDVFETEPAIVEGGMGMTINLGNYESLRIDVGVKMPCYKEEIAQAHEKIFEMVMSELFRRTTEVKEVLKA